MAEDALMARRAALRALALILQEHKTLDEAFRESVVTVAETRERDFAHLLLRTTLRWHGALSALLASRFLTRPLPTKLAAPAKQLLELGLVQLLCLDVPAHAAVDTSVRLAKETLPPFLHGMVNAVLRKAERERTSLQAWLAGTEATAALLPPWLREAAPAADDWARAMLLPAPHDLTVREDADSWEGKLSAQRLPTGSLRLPEGARIPELPGFEEGAWWVQDAAAALPARVLLSKLPSAARVLDLCAAPGGKTAQFAAAGCRVTAVEQNATRIRRLQENLARLHLTAEVMHADATVYRPETPPQGILLDAPCSATGTLRRHPDVAWRRTREDVTALLETQDRLLRHAASLLVPGGVMVYCVCSILPEEGEGRVAAFLSDSPEWRRLPVEAEEIGGVREWCTTEGDIRTHPNAEWRERGGVDGFYISRLQRCD